MVDGRQEKHPEGAYYLDWTEDGKRSRVSVGTDSTVAYNCRTRKPRELDALASSLIDFNPLEDDSRLRISAAVDFSGLINGMSRSSEGGAGCSHEEASATPHRGSTPEACQGRTDLLIQNVIFAN
jgi:hypothetical protein